MTSEASKSISPLGARLYEAIEGEVRRKKDLNQIPLTLMLAELHKLLPAPWDEVRKALVELVGLDRRTPPGVRELKLFFGHVVSVLSWSHPSRGA